jgi:anti-sigma factor ChrR (cupin superfamily)
LAALDAARALDNVARAAFMVRLARADATEREAIAQLYEVAATLHASRVPPSAPSTDVKQRLMQAVGAPAFAFVRAAERQWQTLMPGIQAQVLQIDPERDTAVLLVRAEAGSVYPTHHHSGPEDCYVLSGEVIVQGERLRGGDFHHACSNTAHEPVVCVSAAELLLIVAAADYIPNPT